jgi:hypothetical protein
MSSMRVKVHAKYNSNGIAGFNSYGPYFKLPTICPCCGKSLNNEGINRLFWFSEQHGRIMRTISWQIPYCEFCNNHIQVVSRFILISVCIFFIWTILGGYIIATSNIIENIVIPIYVIVLALIPILSISIGSIFTKKQLGDKCTSWREAIAYKHVEGEIHTILFKNKEYAERFSIANSGQIDETPFNEAPMF